MNTFACYETPTLWKVNGSIVASYNLGLGDHNIGNQTWQVNDGNYHVVKFIRSGINSTLFVDGQHVGSLRPKGS